MSETDVDATETFDVSETEFSVIENLGRAFHVKDADLERTLVAVLTESCALVPDVQHAGVNLLINKRFEPQAVFGEAPPVLDAWQQRTGTGPCVDASRDQQVMRIPDMAKETRWPEFARLALDTGVHAMLCLPLWVDARRLGSLSLYADRPHCFDGNADRVAALLATHASLAISDALRAENLRTAVESRDLIGQAKGILMERHRITADTAFSQLVTASQTTNRKLADIAATLVETGALP